MHSWSQSPDSPSIIVYGLSKNFKEQIAVHQLSFSVAKGQILGFLGPNGAGKSTTMRMVTGYLRPSQGSVHICGYDLSKYPRQAQRHIGCLLEHNPLYLEMYVHEYLQFMGRIHGLGHKQCLAKAKEVVESCGITEMQNKKIKTLSKGYRQRVGLAQALIHGPTVLILDEPTTGLDPNQLREIRGLVKKVGRDKAVILSTHIMQEVEALCDQVLIINHGKMIAYDTLANLATPNSHQLIIEFKEPVIMTNLAQIEGICKVQALTEHKYVLHSNNNGQDMREVLFRFAQENGLTLLGLEQQKSSMEEVFQQLTRKSDKF